MAYTPVPIATPLDLKNRVTALLTGVIGTYRHPSGYTEPAISVGNRHAEGITVTGIEAIVPKTFLVRSSKWAGKHVSQDRYADIILLEWSGDNLNECARRLLLHFPNATGIEIPDFDPIKSLRQYRVTVWLPDGFEAYRI